MRLRKRRKRQMKYWRKTALQMRRPQKQYWRLSVMQTGKNGFRIRQKLSFITKATAGIPGNGLQNWRGKTLTDLAGLDARIAEKQEEQTAADSEYRTADGNYKNHKRIFEKAKEYRTALTSTDSAWQRLDTLGTLAVGSNSESGRISFDRYVMGAVFREILEMANRRLDIMSGGQYELIHKNDADRKNAKAGLEIEVLVTGT